MRFSTVPHISELILAFTDEAFLTLVDKKLGLKKGTT